MISHHYRFININIAMNKSAILTLIAKFIIVKYLTFQ